MADDFPLMGLSQFIELPVLEVAPLVTDFYAAIRIIDDHHTFAGQSPVLGGRIHQLQNLVVLQSEGGRQDSLLLPREDVVEIFIV
jgi:hypothetical protein